MSSSFRNSYFYSTDLPALARHLLDNGPRKTLPSGRRVRVLFNHAYIVDTISAKYIWEHDAYPQFYVPSSSLQNCHKLNEMPVKTSAGQVGAYILSLGITASKTEPERVTDRVISFVGDKKLAGELAGLVRLEFGSMDQWFEEDTPIYVHPKDPFKRIEILSSSRKVVVKLDGHTLATTQHSMHLHETGLPTRYYLPFGALDASLLRKSDLLTKCPYKGDAEYFHVVINGKEYQNLIWMYRLPTLESSLVAGRPCFYNEKVDIEIDGEPLERPKTHFS